MLLGRDAKPAKRKRWLVCDPWSNKPHPSNRSDSGSLHSIGGADDSSLDNSDYLRIEDEYSKYFKQNRQLAKSLDNIGWTEESSKVRKCHQCFKAVVPRCLINTGQRTKAIVSPQDSCFNRLCPLCSKIRRKRALQKLRQIFPDIRNPKLLTLTVRNVPNIDKQYLKWLTDSFSKLRRRKFFSSKCAGGVYSIETTINKNDGTWHVHIHALLDSEYINQGEISEAWENITKGIGRIVDIRQADEGSLDEIIKYVTKGIDIVADPRRVEEFLTATHRRRMLSTFGDFYGFDFEDDVVEFPRCPECGRTDKEHYIVIRHNVPASEVFAFTGNYDLDRSFNSS